MAETMRERIARAISQNQCFEHYETCEHDGLFKCSCRNTAIAVLAAMRELMEEVGRAGKKELGKSGVRRVSRAMIDAASKEPADE